MPAPKTAKASEFVAMSNIYELQRWLYANAIDAMNGLRAAGVAQLPVLTCAGRSNTD